MTATLQHHFTIETRRAGDQTEFRSVCTCADLGATPYSSASAWTDSSNTARGHGSRHHRQSHR